MTSCLQIASADAVDVGAVDAADAACTAGRYAAANLSAAVARRRTSRVPAGCCTPPACAFPGGIRVV